jgi:hypothetical protein
VKKNSGTDFPAKKVNYLFAADIEIIIVLLSRL